VHREEYGGSAHLRPAMVRRVCDLIKEAGGKPFVTDTSAVYPLGRFTTNMYLATAAYNGFTEESVGAPVMIADGEGGYDGEWVDIPRRVSRCSLRKVKVARKIFDADYLVVLSHVKGHGLSGIGGAIKKLTKGCITKESKAAQRKANWAVLDNSKYEGCGQCAWASTSEALLLVKKMIVKSRVSLAQAASGVLSRFVCETAFINFIKDVTPFRDCAMPAGLPVVPDIGIVASTDVVAVDKASLDLMAQSKPLGKYAGIKSLDIVGKRHGTNSLAQLKVSHGLGLGSIEYQVTPQRIGVPSDRVSL